MWMGILGLLGGVLSLTTVVISVGEILVTGSWRDWGIFDWVVNVGMSVLSLLPFVGTIPMVGRISALGFAWLAKLVSHVPLIGKIATMIWALRTGLRTFFDLYLMKWFVKGGWLYNIGRAVAQLVMQLRKPWVLFGVLLLSSLADGIFSRVFQIWGDISLRAANVAFEMVSRAMSEGGYGNPISDSIAILAGSKSSLPPCFTAIWGAVGASECIGLIVTTFQYLALLSALRVGYRLYGQNGVPNS